jgi:hypothetical protein
MASRRRLRCSFLLLALLPSLLVELSCRDDRPRTTEAAETTGATDQAIGSAAKIGLVALQRHIAWSEYRASSNEHGLQAPNRAHNLRTYFEPTGIRVHDRTAVGSPELLALNLVGVGRGEPLARVGPGQVSSDGPRVEIRRPGLVEWYVNRASGLEQGFTIEQRPEGEGPLVLELSVAGRNAESNGDAVVFRSATGRPLHYGGLVAMDASGRSLMAQLEVPAIDRVRLRVEESGAKYPLTIDPTLTATAGAQLEADQSDARFGQSVASADVNGDGYSDMIVGAYAYDAGQTDEGAVFVFLGSSSGITSQHPAAAATQLEADQTNANFGYSVADAGDVDGDGYSDVIIGARYYQTGYVDEGAAFVFLGSASGVASGNPTSAATQLEANQANAELGVSVAGAGDVNGDGYADVIVGAQYYDAGQSFEGAAFVFLGSANGIASGSPATAAAQLESDQANAEFGVSVAGAGDVDGDGYDDVIVGADGYDGGHSNEGAAFLFLGSATGIASGSPLTAATQIEADQANARLGHRVAGAGDVNGDGHADVIVGARNYEAGQAIEGAAFVFLGSPSGVASGSPATAATQLEADQVFAQFGVSVAGAGDVNGDGYSDVIVGARFYDAGQSDEGAAFVFLGSAGGIASGSPATAAVQLEANQDNANLGYSVGGACDVNGDGYSDVAVGSRFYDAGETNEGAVFVFLPEPESSLAWVIFLALLVLVDSHRRRREPYR